MNKYKDAIASKNEKTGRYKKIVSGDFVLFPYRN